MIVKLKQLLSLYMPNKTVARVAGSIFWTGIIGEYATTHPLTIWLALQILGVAMLGFIFIWMKKKGK